MIPDHLAIYYTRKQKGYSQERLARLIGENRQLIADVENQRCKASDKLIKKIILHFPDFSDYQKKHKIDYYYNQVRNRVLPLLRARKIYDFHRFYNELKNIKSYDNKNENIGYHDLFTIFKKVMNDLVREKKAKSLSTGIYLIIKI